MTLNMTPTRGLMTACFTAALVVSAFYFMPSESDGYLTAGSMDEVDEFKRSLQRSLHSDHQTFSIIKLAAKLGEMTAGGFPVCVSEEIAAAQYIELVEIDENLMAAAPTVAAQLHAMLEQGLPVSDCQFRVLEAATTTAKASRL